MNDNTVQMYLAACYSARVLHAVTNSEALYKQLTHLPSSIDNMKAELKRLQGLHIKFGDLSQRDFAAYQNMITLERTLARMKQEGVNAA